MGRSQMACAAAITAAVALLAVPASVAKDFSPGDLLLCGRGQCVSITSRSTLRVLSSYYYGSTPIRRAAPVPLGAPAYQLRWPDGYVSASVTARFDRFRAYGFFCGRFVRGTWYRFPARAARDLRRLASDLTPLHVAPPPRSC
jgi:hypothetical protein